MSRSTPQHIVLISGGLASFEAGRRVLDKYGRDNTRFWFFDTLMEDEDLYRFLGDCEQALGATIERFVEGRTPWQIFHDKRFIGNSHADMCSRILKRELLERLLREQYPDRNVVLYMGLEWTEDHRIKRVRDEWAAKGYTVEFPLVSEPLLFPHDLHTHVEELGIAPPRLYNLGFPHNNCGGACVKAGIKQWALLWRTFPERFSWHEEQEEAIRQYLGKDVSILKDRRGGKTRSLTLRARRQRLEAEMLGADIDTHLASMEDDWVCSCFIASPDIASD